MWICTVPKVISISCIKSLVDSVLEILNMFWNLLERLYFSWKPTLCLLNRYVKDIKYRFSEKCKNYFWEWHFGNGDADALEREGNIPLREILFCLSLCFLLSIFLFYLCLCVCSISRNSVCSAFNGQDKNTQSWGLWLSHSITGTKCLFSVCLSVCFLFVWVWFLSICTFVS